MQSVAHNGFGCPYCRTKMADEPEEEDEEDEEDYNEDEEDEDEEDALRGFRLFWNNVNGEEHELDDDVAERLMEEEWEDSEDDEEEQNHAIPTSNFVAEKLRLHNVSYEDLVKILLLRDHEVYQDQEDEEQVDRLDGEVFGKMRIIISNYDPQQAIPTIVEPNPPVQ